MEEKEIMEIASNKEVLLADCRVRCIVDNAKCIMKASTESIMWCVSKMRNDSYIFSVTFFF